MDVLVCNAAAALLQAGTFCLASEDVLKSRPIKKAKRRNVGSEVRTGPPDEPVLLNWI